MANIPSPWRGSAMGAGPLFQSFPVAVGTTRTIDKGDICYMDTGDSDLIKVSGPTDNLHAHVIADEAQTATDPERFLRCIVPKYGDVFEFDLDASTQVQWGQRLQISDSQTLKVSPTDSVACVVETDAILPKTGATQPTVTKVLCTFRVVEQTLAAAELPLVGQNLGDAS